MVITKQLIWGAEYSLTYFYTLKNAQRDDSPFDNDTLDYHDGYNTVLSLLLLAGELLCILFDVLIFNGPLQTRKKNTSKQCR